MILTDLLQDCLYPSQEQIDNCIKLIAVVNAFEDLLGLKFKCTSGLRTIEKHCNIYKKLQAQDIADHKPPRPIPMGSQHLKGNAVDFICPTYPIADLHGLFLLKAATDLSEEKGAWFEKFAYTPTWIHMQRVSPASKQMFFRPF